ncbi:hypothetical protein D3C76_1839880 [compost metagenome]
MQVEEQLHGEQQRLQAAHAELGTMREHAAAVQARADTLAQQAKLQDTTTSPKRPARVRKAPEKGR